MVNLPSHPRQAWLKSFWLAIALLSGSVIGVLLAFLQSSLWLGGGIMLGIVTALPGLLWPQAVKSSYHVWNKLSGLYMHAARVAVKAICFYIIIVTTGWGGTSLRLARPTFAESFWQSRRTLAPASYPYQYEADARHHSWKNWQGLYLSWSAYSGNWWTICLLPFLIVLSFLDTEDESDLPSKIYTLF